MFHSRGTHYPKSYLMTTGCDFVMKELKVISLSPLPPPSSPSGGAIHGPVPAILLPVTSGQKRAIFPLHVGKTSIFPTKTSIEILNHKP